MLPYELGHQITTENSANFMLAASIGEGTLAVFVGSLIDGEFLPIFSSIVLLSLISSCFIVLSYCLSELR
jgi:hypothetical protein